MYKAGDWLKHKKTGEIVKLIAIKDWRDEWQRATLQLPNGYTTELLFTMYNTIYDVHEPAPTAQVLYGDKHGT